MLTSDQIRAVQMTFDSVSAVKVAEAIGVHRTTIADWKAMPEFREALAMLETEQLDTAKRLARKGAAMGVRIQMQLASGKDEHGKTVKHETRLAAANQLTKYLPLAAPVETKTEVSGTLTTQTPDMAAIEAERARLAEERAALLAELGRE